MRKIFALLACAALMFSCGGSTANNSECNKGCDAKEPAEVVKITSAEFAAKVADINSEWKYLGDKPAVVDFYADWCPPCRMIAPVLDEIAKENPNIYVYKVNIDDCPDIAKAYNVVSIPTLLFIPMSGEPVREVGFLTKGVIENIIKEHLLR
ncbi:MAG: thioredoxin [Bacteroidaceae bacterium]|nr:thioredoxin [Bacteroidaceae bacterium]